MMTKGISPKNAFTTDFLHLSDSFRYVCIYIWNGRPRAPTTLTQRGSNHTHCRSVQHRTKWKRKSVSKYTRFKWVETMIMMPVGDPSNKGKEFMHVLWDWRQFYRWFKRCREDAEQEKNIKYHSGLVNAIYRRHACRVHNIKIKKNKDENLEWLIKGRRRKKSEEANLPMAIRFFLSFSSSIFESRILTHTHFIAIKFRNR